MTGYQVYWSVGTHSGGVSAGVRDTAVTITRHGLTPGLTYDVIIVALSDHLPSPVVGPVRVALGKVQHYLRVSSSIKVSWGNQCYLQCGLTCQTPRQIYMSQGQ